MDQETIELFKYINKNPELVDEVKMLYKELNPHLDTLSTDEQIKIAESLDCWSMEVSKLMKIIIEVEGFSGLYIYEPIKGGKQLIVGSDGKVLMFASSLKHSDVINDIKHNNLWEKAVYPNQLKK